MALTANALGGPLGVDTVQSIDPEQALEQEITEGLSELRDLLGGCSTRSVAGWCFVYQILALESDDSELRLMSPGKQIPLLLGVLLSTPEPTQPDDFGDAEWKPAKSILDRLFSAYLRLYMPTEEQLGPLAPEWYRTREVSMLAFLHYFNSGLLASPHQVADRMNAYLVPFDMELSEAFGINMSYALDICQWIANQLQESFDDLMASVQAEQEHRLKLLERAENENWSFDALQNAARDPFYMEKAEKLVSGMGNLGIVSLADLRSVFPDVADTFWELFSVQRGKGPEIRYPTEQSICETRPLIQIGGEQAFCPSVNKLFTALLLVGERVLLQGPARDRFLRAHDQTLEAETLREIRAFLSQDASIWSGVYETPRSQYEHDVIAVDEGLCLIVEAKAAPPIEPFRDPDKAFVRLRDMFRADRGIQKAYEQANRVVRRLKDGIAVQLYDAHGREVGRLLPDPSRLSIAMCVTRDNFGGLATNLSLLLEKDADDSYPWVVNILDLSSLAEAWSYFGWGSAEFREYLEQRILLHGRVFSDDELDYAGYFVRHGDLMSALNTRADLVLISPEYSAIFDDIYRHLHLGGPPVRVEQTEPVLMDLGRSLMLDQSVFVDTEGPARLCGKIGRNEPCPCGSGKKYKRCCGANR